MAPSGTEGAGRAGEPGQAQEPRGAAGSGRTGEAGRAEDVLRRLEARLERASDAAERLFSEAASEAAAAVRRGTRSGEPGPAGPSGDREPSEPPPQGWQRSADQPPPGRGDLEVIIAALDSVRQLLPPDLRQRLAEAVKELLLAVRALIDWYLERLDQRRGQAAEVEDIPVL